MGSMDAARLPQVTVTYNEHDENDDDPDVLEDCGAEKCPWTYSLHVCTGEAVAFLFDTEAQGLIQLNQRALDDLLAWVTHARDTGSNSAPAVLVGPTETDVYAMFTSIRGDIHIRETPEDLPSAVPVTKGMDPAVLGFDLQPPGEYDTTCITVPLASRDVFIAYLMFVGTRLAAQPQ